MTFDEILNLSVGDELFRMVFSKPEKDAFSVKMKVRPIIIKGKTFFQVTNTIGTKETNTVKETHENFQKKELLSEIKKVFPTNFKQALIETKSAGYTVLAGKKGNITVRKNASVSAPLENNMEHNRKKQYLINEGEPVPFMVDLGVMNREGKVITSKYDKFRQINRYLEFVSDVMEKLPKDREITIVDFGCGKSYLTFALYYYLVKKQNRNVKIVGLDLKTDVITECNRLRDKYGYKGLSFLQGDIEHYESDSGVDMVISLHACDTATDYAIYKGILWKASVIMAVPCCQHELNKNAEISELHGLFQYGILKDRVCAAFTDAIRANCLKEWGYDAQILEFIDLEHTPKNLLIRAVKKDNKMESKASFEKSTDLKEFIGSSITLEKLLDDLKNNEESDI